MFIPAFHPSIEQNNLSCILIVILFSQARRAHRAWSISGDKGGTPLLDFANSRKLRFRGFRINNHVTDFLVNVRRTGGFQLAVAEQDRESTAILSTVSSQLFVRVISLTALSTCFFRPDPVFNPPWFRRQFPPHFRPVISTTFRRVISTIFQRARSAWFRRVISTQ